MKSLSVIVILAIPVLLSTCREDDELPPITMEGKGTFGCLVNGKLLISLGPSGPGTHAQVFHLPDTLAVNIYAGNYIENQTIFISILATPDLQINKIYDLYKNSCCGLQYLKYDEEGSCSYELPTSGHVKISRWDESKGILAGTFQFTAESDKCPGTVVITEGRFDIGEIIY